MYAIALICSKYAQILNQRNAIFENKVDRRLHEKVEITHALTAAARPKKNFEIRNKLLTITQISNKETGIMLEFIFIFITITLHLDLFLIFNCQKLRRKNTNRYLAEHVLRSVVALTHNSHSVSSTTHKHYVIA